MLWRGRPGWFSGRKSGSNGGSRRSGHEIGRVSETWGGTTISIEVDFTALTATLLGQEISLADGNLLLVDGVGEPGGGRVVERISVDPTLPAPATPGVITVSDIPVVIAIRRAPAAGAFLQCDVSLPMPTNVDSGAVDPVVVGRLAEALQGMVASLCRAIGP